jgi:hypothetical protein
MPRIRFSIASLVGLVFALAFSFAALRAANPAWDAVCLGVTIFVLPLSILLAVHRQGKRRAFWLGFAIFGGVYFLASLIPSVESRLPSTKALGYLAQMRAKSDSLGMAVADFDSDGYVDLFVTNASPSNTIYLNRGDGTFRAVSQSNTPTQVNNTYLTRLGLWSVMAGGGGAENFTRIGHSLLVLVAGCVGGWVSGLIDRRHREDRSRLPAR